MYVCMYNEAGCCCCFNILTIIISLSKTRFRVTEWDKELYCYINLITNTPQCTYFSTGCTYRNPWAGLKRPCVFQEFQASQFLDNRHMKVARLSVLNTVCLYPQETFLVLIAVRNWIDHRVVLRPEGLCQWKIPFTLSGIEPATFRLLAVCLNQLRHALPLVYRNAHKTSRHIQQPVACMLWTSNMNAIITYYRLCDSLTAVNNQTEICRSV
jgi:hypothetical protein